MSLVCNGVAGLPPPQRTETMTRAELESTYKVQGNRIVSPGKFEAENIWCPHFWDVAMDGGGEEITTPHCPFPVSRVPIEPEDVAQFPELEGFSNVELFEDDNGFVFCEARP